MTTLHYNICRCGRLIRQLRYSQDWIHEPILPTENHVAQPISFYTEFEDRILNGGGGGARF